MLARDVATNAGDLDSLKNTPHDGMKLGGQKTGLALTEKLLGEVKAAVDGEVASQEERHEEEPRAAHPRTLSEVVSIDTP
ncbi:hypothetical protein SLS55_001707 [Diplodia seriata]|uniref:Uncharacterized protein n=1 Tax=Diplodia seriata TaxID=420778 RepID=A0ABR3CQ35_9PEZI